MPISDYANAFFFVHRTRVTFKSRGARDCTGDLFESASFSARCAFTVSQQRWLSRPVAIRKNAEEISSAENTARKTKARRCRAFGKLLALGWLISPAWQSDA